MRPRKRRCCSSSVIENQYFQDLDARAHQHAFELRHRAEELFVFVVAAKTHHALDAGAVVPAAVEQHHFAGRGQVGRVALEIPLGAFAVVGRGQGDHAGHARVEALGDALDHAAFAGRIAAFKQDHHLLFLGSDPVLQLHQFTLQAKQLAEVGQAFGFFFAALRARQAIGDAVRVAGPRSRVRALRRNCRAGRARCAVSGGRGVGGSWRCFLAGRSA